MDYNITIDRKRLQHEVHLRTYYMGEAIKRKEIDADTIESSDDESELFGILLRKAINQMMQSVALRFSSVEYSIDDAYISLTFNNADEKREKLLPLLQQSINDYLVSELTAQWLNLRQPALAQGYDYRHIQWISSVKEALSMFYNHKKVRRRPTNLAGI
ncbi:MAG: hypothetical protein IKA41_06960 [Bacteroidaceae bacterium]|nr:hypothetical protein [Bacteroidaceae bacterium]